jgi:DNA-binding FrmR family transcriptional regulator
MTGTKVPPETISELADRLERIQQELFSIQRSLEKMEPIEAAVQFEAAVQSAEPSNKRA